jgi:hypothetical protein
MKNSDDFSPLSGRAVTTTPGDTIRPELRALRRQLAGDPAANRALPGREMASTGS